jgi:hypothetical protein
MKIVAPRVLYSVLFYAMAMALIIVSKPSPVFDAGGKPIEFGLGPDKTLFSLGAVTVALAVLSFYIFALIDMVFAQ